MNTFEQAIGAGATISFPGGRQFLLLETSSAVDVRFFNPKNNPSEYAKGIQAGFKATFKDRFLKVEITSAAAQTVKVGISDIADCTYNRSSGNVDADVIPGTALAIVTDWSVAAGATTAGFPANSDRRFAIVQSHKNNVGEIRVGGSTAASNRGTSLDPGETLSLPCSAGLWVRNPNSIAVKVLLSEVTK